MVPDLLDTIAFIRVGFKYILKEVLGIRGKELRKRIVSIKDFLVKIGSFLVLYCNSKTNMDNYLKGKVSTQHCVEDHPATPEVRLQAVVPVPSNHLSFISWQTYLRGCIARTPTGCFQGAPLIVHVA